MTEILEVAEMTEILNPSDPIRSQVFELDPLAPNIMPRRYRKVSVANVGSLSDDHLMAYFSGREAFRHTKFVVAFTKKDSRDTQECALVELARDGSRDLFSVPIGVRVIASAHDCVFVHDGSVDIGIASHMAAVAQRFPAKRCVVVEGRYHHVSFLLNPEPVEITLLDVVPPRPSKLADQVARVLDFDEGLPPTVITEHIVDSRSLLAESTETQETSVSLEGGLTVPCRGGGITVDGVETSHLDERPPQAGATLLGCKRSQQIHRWFYGDDPPRIVDWCPRRLIPDTPAATAGSPGLKLIRCCLLSEGFERTGDTMIVPWGATLAEVHKALVALSETKESRWTLT